MKNIVGVKFLSVIALMSAVSIAANDATRSFFSVRPVSDTLMPQNLMLDQEHNMGKINKQRNSQFTFFVSQSRENEKLARYFFQGKTTLVVNEVAPNNVSGEEVKQDILARDFNIVTNGNIFSSEISIAPKQTVYGGTFSLRGYFGETKQWSLGVEVPVVYVRNNLHLDEKVTGTFTATPGVGLLDQQDYVGSMKEAFAQKGMKYGKIDGVRNAKGFGNIVVKLGYEPCAFCNLDDKYMNAYLGVILPTDNKPKAEYMFEPMRGNNGHTGVVMGTALEALMKSGHTLNFWSRWNIESRYLFENTQKRSFDLLLNGPWSRYLQMYENTSLLAADQPTFGINLLTQDAKVRPGYQCKIDSSLCAAGERWHASVGTTVFANQAEKIKLANEWRQAHYIGSYLTPGETNRFRQSGREYVQLDNTGDVAIKESDIDLDSAAHPAAISQMIYATLGGYKEGAKPCMYEVGASYEFSCMNTSVNRWGVWGTVQYSF